MRKKIKRQQLNNYYFPNLFLAELRLEQFLGKIKIFSREQRVTELFIINVI